MSVRGRVGGSHHSAPCMCPVHALLHTTSTGNTASGQRDPALPARPLRRTFRVEQASSMRCFTASNSLHNKNKNSPTLFVFTQPYLQC